MGKKKLIVGIPKGSLQEHTIEIFRAAGFNPQVSDRGYIVPTADSAIQCILLRAQEIPRYVCEGRLDAGITGEDWIKETEANVQGVADLRYAKHGIKKVQWVLAVPENSSIASARDLKGKTVATEAVGIAKDYFKGVPLPSRGYFHAGDKNSGVLRIKEFLQGQGLPTPELPESEEEAVEGVDDDFFDATTEEQLKRWKLTIYQRTGTCLGNSYLEGCEPDGKFGQAELDAIKSERGNLYKILRQVATGTDQPSKTKVVVRVGNQPEVVLNEGQIESKGYKSSPTVLERIKNVFRAWMEGMNNLSKKLFGAPSQPPAREAPPARPAPTPPPVSFPPGT